MEQGGEEGPVKTPRRNARVCSRIAASMSIRSVGSDFGQFLPEEEGGSRQVLQVQRALNQLSGAEALPEDGIFTPETQRAVQEFQRTHKLPETGIIDERTVDLMQIALRKTESSPPVAAPATQGTGKQDLNLAGVLMQSKFGLPAGSAPATAQRLFVDSFQSTLGALLPSVSSREGITGLQSLQNPFLSLGCSIGQSWSDSAIQQAAAQFRSAGTLNPDALDFANLIESIQGDPEQLNAQNWPSFAQLCAGYAETMLGAAQPMIPEALLPSLAGFNPQAQMAGVDFVKQSGEQLAIFMAGLAAGASPAGNAAGLEAMTGASLAAVQAATGLVPGDGMFLPMLAGAMLNLTQQLPELMRLCGVQMDINANSCGYVAMNVAVTSIVSAVIMATQQQSIIRTDRQVASIVRSTIRSEVEISGILVNDALQEVLKHQETTTREILAASIQAMTAAQTGDTDQGALVRTGNTQDLSMLIRNTAQKVMDVTGKITESSRMLRLLSGR